MHILSPVTDNCSSKISGRRNESTWPDQVLNPGPLTYESGALPTALCGPAVVLEYYSVWLRCLNIKCMVEVSEYIVYG